MNTSIETATNNIKAVNAFLILCCFAAEDEGSLVGLSDFWALFDLMQRTAKEAQDALTALEEGDEAQ